MSIHQRVLRIFLRMAIALVVLATLTAAALYGIAQTQWAKNHLADMIETAMRSDDGRRLRIGQITGVGLSRLQFSDVSLADGDGIWLNIDEAEIRWRPWRLIIGALRIDTLLIAKLHIERKPVSRQPKSFQIPSLPDLPLALNIRAFDISSLTVGSGLSAVPDALGARGALVFDKGGDARLELQTVSDKEVDLNIDIGARYDSAAGTLRLDVVAADRKGVLSSFLAVPAGTPVAIDIHGDGPTEAWRGRALFNVDAKYLLDAEVTSEKIGESTRLRIFGTLDPPILLSQKLPTIIAGPYAVDIALDLERAAPHRLHELSLSNDAIAMTAHGSIDLTQQSLDVNFTFASLDAQALQTLAPPLSLDGVAGTGRLTGPLATPRVSIALKADNLGIAELQSAQSEVRVLIENIAPSANEGPVSITVDGTLNDAERRAGDGETIAVGDIVWVIESEYDRAAKRFVIQRSEMESDAISFAADGDVILMDKNQPRIQLSFRAEIFDLPIANARLHAFFSEPATIEGTLSHAAIDSVWRVDDLRIAHAIGDVQSSMAYDETSRTLDSTYQLTIDDLTPLGDLFDAPVGGGRLILKGSASGPVSDLSTRAEWTLPSFIYNRLTLSNVHGELSALDVIKAPQMDLTLDFVSPAGPGHLKARVYRDRQSGSLHITDTAVETKTTTLQGEVELAPDGHPLRGRLSGSVQSLGDWSGLAGAYLDGQVDFTSRFENVGAAPEITGELTGVNVTIQLPEAPAIHLKEIKLTAQPETLSGLAQTAFSLSVNAVTRGALQLDQSIIEGATDGRTARMRVYANGRYQSAFDLQAKTTWELNDPGFTASLEEFTANIFGQQWDLMQAAQIRLGPDSLDLTRLILVSDISRIEGEVNLRDDALLLHAEFEEAPLQLLNLARPPVELSGVTTGSLDLTIKGDVRAGEAALDFKDVIFPGAAGAGLSGPFTGTWNGSRLNLTTDLKGDAGDVISITADLPFIYGGAEGFYLPQDRPIRVNGVWRNDIAPLWKATQPDIHMLSGLANVNFNIRGTLANPILAGDLKLTGGTYRHLDFGTAIDDINLDVGVAEGRGQILTATAVTGSSGRLSATGGMDFDPGKKFPVDLELTLKEATLVQRSDINARVSGQMIYRRSGDKRSVQGHLTSDEINIRLINALPADVFELDVIEIGAAFPNQIPSDTAPRVAGPEKTELNIDIIIPQRAFVRGRGLDSEWFGDLHVRGTTAAPRISGELKPVRGQFNFADRVFTLGDGSLRFDGGEKIDPSLDLQAHFDAKDLSVTVTISGSSTKPKIQLTSQPFLPENEILSRILFGSDASQLSALEAVQLADATRALAGSGSGVGSLLGATRDAFGLDVLRFGQGEQDQGVTNTTVTGGKYLLDNVYLEVQSGIDPSQTKMSLEVEMTKNLSVESELTRQKGSNIGFNWRWNY